MQTKPTEMVLKKLENNNSSNEVQSQNINPQVKALKQKTVRRKFNKSDKLNFINIFDACADAQERGAFLRKNGLYDSSIRRWKNELSGKTACHMNSKSYKATLLNNQLQRENNRLRKQLAQAEAIIDIQKKVSQLLSMSALDHEKSEVQS